MTGKAEGNAMTSRITFTAETGEIFRLDPMGPADATEQGHYHCVDQHDQEWLLIDYEDHAELYPVRESARI